MADYLKWAPSAYRLLNGIVAVYKPPGMSVRRMLDVIRINLSDDLNTLPCYRGEQRSHITPGLEVDDKSLMLSVPDLPDLTEHRLVLGPRYIPEDIKIASTNRLSKLASGVQVLGIGKGCKLIEHMALARHMRKSNMDTDSGESEYSDMEELVSEAFSAMKKELEIIKKNKSKTNASDNLEPKTDQEDGITFSSKKQSNDMRRTVQKAMAATTTTTGHPRHSSDKAKKGDKPGVPVSREVSAIPERMPQPKESWRQHRKKYRKDKAATTGKNWFQMKAPEMTEQQKNDLLVLQMRQALDSKTFYRGNDRKVLPKFFQIGTVEDSPQDFYHRIPKKQRKQTIVDELLADAEFRTYNKKKYAEIMDEKRRGVGPYKKQKFVKRLKKRF